MKILITGSRGFLGSSIGAFAAAAGHEIFGLGRASSAVSDWPGSYLQTDVATSDLSEVVKSFSPDLVVHAAGSASVGMSIKAPFDDFRAATLTFANVLDSVRRSRLNPLIILPSSAAVYGSPTRLPISEEVLPQPISPYGFHKWACELLAHEYAKCFAMRLMICRLFSVFGPGQRRLFIWEVFQQATSGQPYIELQGTGMETRDYLHVDDLSRLLLKLVGLPQLREHGKCLTVNVGSGNEVQVIEIARLIRDLVSPTKEIACRGEVRPGDPQFWQADVALLRSLVPDWQPPLLSERVSQCISQWTGIGES